MASGIPQANLPVQAEPQPHNTTLDNQSTNFKTKDVEKQSTNDTEDSTVKQSAFKGLGWLDRFLAVWIFLAMAIGIILGNFVENTGPALQKGKFVGVSIPIGMYPRNLQEYGLQLNNTSYWSLGHDVSHTLQSAIRIFTPRLPRAWYLDPNCI